MKEVGISTMENTKYDLSIGIVTYNNADLIATVLNDLFAHLPQGLRCCVYVLDNCSTYRTPVIVRNSGHDILMLKTQKNIGFGRGHNTIIQQVNSRYHAIINPDIFIKDNVLELLYHFMEQSPDVGMATPCVRYPDGRIQHHGKRDPNFIDLFIRLFLPNRFAKRQERYQMLDQDFTTVFDVESASGCFLFARTALLRAVGGFDPRFFMYFEDADLSRRMRQLARVVYFPDGHVIHHWNRDSRRSLKMMLVMLGSSLRYLTKWAFASDKRRKRT